MLSGKRGWIALAVGMGVGISIFGVRQYRQHQAELLLGTTKEQLGRAQELRTLFLAGKVPPGEIAAKVAEVGQFLQSHTAAEPLTEYADLQLVLADTTTHAELWREAGTYLEGPRALSSGGLPALQKGEAHLLMAEATAEHAHLQEFAKLAISTCELSLAQGAEADATRLRLLNQRLALVKAELAKQVAVTAWEAEQNRLAEARQVSLAQGEKLAATLQKETQAAIAKAEADRAKAVEANEPSLVASAEMARNAAEKNHFETLARREAELRGKLLKDYEASPALLEARKAWVAAATLARQSAEPNSTVKIKAKNLLMEALTTAEQATEAKTLAATYPAAINEFLAVDPEHLLKRKLAAG
jgi:hypothetical protein